MIKIGYKVVSFKLKSIVDTSLDDGFSVQYKIGEFVEPRVKGSCLFVFDELGHAKTFAAWNMGQVYKCEYEPKNYKHVPLVELSEVSKFWKFKLGKKKTVGVIFQKDGYPTGTKMASKVKLLHKAY